MYKDLLELAGSSGAGRVISKLVTFAGPRCMDSFKFSCLPLDETIANTYFLESL